MLQVIIFVIRMNLILRRVHQVINPIIQFRIIISPKEQSLLKKVIETDIILLSYAID